MLKRAISLLCVLALVLTVLVPGWSASAAGDTQQRVIDVVYDDSGSMCSDGTGAVDRWSQALYAMEVFATMLGAQDEMNVYLMSDFGANPTNVKGSDDGRVDQIIGSLGETGNTPFETVEAAASHITSVDPAASRWLVVLTDGEFQHQPSQGLQAALAEYAAQGIQVVYLGIGAAEQLTGDDANGFYAYSAGSSAEILPCITEIANQIFQQQILPASHITTSGNTMTLNIDIPVDQLLVFAQGEGISVEGMTGDSGQLTPTGSHRVEVTEANTPQGWQGQTILAPGLCGVVQTYTAGEQPYAKGTYTLTVSDPSNVEIYYIAGTDIDCHLTYNGVEVKDDEKHYAGEYGISMRFLDPLTGEEVQSDLLDGAVFTAELKNGEEVQSIDSSTTSVFLQEGDVELSASAELPGHVTVTSSHTYTVYPEPIQLDVAAQIPGDYKLSALGPQAEPILITVTHQDTGEKLSQEEWDAIDAGGLTVSSDGNVNWLVQKGSEVSTWEIRPDYITDMTDTGSGQMELTVKAEYELGTQAAAGAGAFQVNIADYVASELKIEILPPEQPIPLNNVSGAEGAQVKVYTKDEYTGAYNLLTQEQTEAVQLTLEAGALDWALEPTGEAGVWSLKPKDDPAALTYSGDQVAVLVNGTLEEGSYRYQGSGSENIPVQALTLLEKLIRALPYIGAGALLLFLLIGYLGKKKLRLKHMQPTVVNVNVRPRKTLNVKCTKVWWSYLLPYFAQRATFSSHQPVFNCRFANVTIKAAGGNSFYIVNLKSFAGKATRIDGEEVDAKQDRHKKFYISTVIASYKNNKATGEFHFV